MTVNVTFYQYASIGGTGAAVFSDLITDSRFENSSGTEATAGMTLSFNGSTTTLAMDETAYLQDDAVTNVITSTGTVNGITVDSSTSVEYNMTAVMEDPATGLWYRLDAFAFDLADENYGFTVSYGWDPTTQSYTTTAYAGQTLTIMGFDDTENAANNVAGVAVSRNNTDFQDFTRYDGSGTYELNPDNDDVAGGSIADIADASICFLKGTKIQTASGTWTRIENLSEGDLVLTIDNGPKPIKWIGENEVSRKKLKSNPHLAPIRVCAGALGNDLPEMDLLVSPQHRILVHSKVAQKMFGVDEVLIATKQLLAIDGIDVAEDIEDVVYYHFLFDQHELIYANGAPTESLYTGPAAINTLGKESLAEVLKIFPELRELDYCAIEARRLLKGPRAHKLVARHMKNNNKPLVCALTA